MEEAGIPTLSMTSARDITEAVKPPRAVFLNFPLGHQSGPAFDPERQRQIVREALSCFKTIKKPGSIVDLPYQWTRDPDWEAKVLRD